MQKLTDEQFRVAIAFLRGPVEANLHPDKPNTSFIDGWLSAVGILFGFEEQTRLKDALDLTKK